MRILVTGGAGFIGSHIADQLAADGHSVTVLDALVPNAHGRRGVPEYLRGHHFVSGDVTDAALLGELLASVDAVCHQAAVVGHGLDPGDAPDYVWHNDYATAVLLAGMYAAGVSRLVLGSSMVVYGEGRYRCAEHGRVRPSARRQSDVDAGRYDPVCPRCAVALVPELVGEDAELAPRSTYAATKLAQEQLAAAWARQTGGSVFALRYHNVYGPRMPRNTPYAGVASLFRSALERGEAPVVLEDGKQRRDFVHVTDVAGANVRALGAPAEPGAMTALNVCSGEPHTVGELATTLAEAYGGPAARIVGGARAADVRHIVADPALAREVLGFRARTAFHTGVMAFATDPLRDPVLDQPAGVSR